MHANRPLFALEMKTGYQGNSKIWGPKIGFPNHIRNKGEYQEVQLRKKKKKKKHAFIDYFLQLQIKPGLYTNYLIKSSQQPNWVGEIILQMMKWDLEKPNSCLKATELINGGSKAIPFSCSHFLISDLLWDTVNVPHWKIYNPSHRNPLLYIHDSEPRHTEVHIILVVIAECCPPGCWSICVYTGTLWVKVCATSGQRLLCPGTSA